VFICDKFPASEGTAIVTLSGFMAVDEFVRCAGVAIHEVIPNTLRARFCGVPSRLDVTPCARPIVFELALLEAGCLLSPSRRSFCDLLQGFYTLQHRGPELEALCGTATRLMTAAPQCVFWFEKTVLSQVLLPIAAESGATPEFLENFWNLSCAVQSRLTDVDLSSVVKVARRRLQYCGGDTGVANDVVGLLGNLWRLSERKKTLATTLNATYVQLLATRTVTEWCWPVTEALGSCLATACLCLCITRWICALLF
jgi:hypothetical protein